MAMDLETYFIHILAHTHTQFIKAYDYSKLKDERPKYEDWFQEEST